MSDHLNKADPPKKSVPPAPNSDPPKKKLSGAQRRKLKSQQSEDGEKLLSKIPKIAGFFRGIPPHPASGSAAAGTSSSLTEFEPVALPVLDTEGGNESKSSEPPEEENKQDKRVECLPVGIKDDLTGALSSTSTMIVKESDSSQQVNVFTLSDDPALWQISEDTRDYVAMHGVYQNVKDFSSSKRKYGDKSRYLSSQLFKRQLKNGEVRNRSWMAYSKSKGFVLCIPCLLFGTNPSSFTKGFDDWKNSSMRVERHEKSADHQSAVTSMKVRGKAQGRVDKHLVEQLEEETHYWRNVLKRVCVVVKTLAVRGLPFCGSNEPIGSVDNGTFLGVLEAVAHFDPFLSGHLQKHSNVGSGNLSYTSKTTYNELIQLMHDKLQRQIVNELKTAKYFGISVDSTPDIAHIDQLTFILRYVKDGVPVERFLCFIANVGHKAEQLANAVFTTLEKHDIDIMDCRGQSYDNASNMSGIYSGLQARIHDVNNLAHFAPCAAHSLNLVGISAAQSCPEAKSFFDFLQGLYSFFSASTRCWEVLAEHLKLDAANTHTLQNLSTTRWSARHDACLALKDGWPYLKSALTHFKGDPKEKLNTHSEAKGLLNKLSRLKTSLMATIWGSILQQFNAVSKKLQKQNTDLGIVGQLFASLSDFVSSMRDNYLHYEKLAKTAFGITEYESDNKRKKKRTTRADESSEKDVAHESASESFCINTFYVIVDRLTEELRQRSEAYKDLFRKFGFLECITQMDIPAEQIFSCAEKLVTEYSCDLEKSLGDECINLRAYINNMAGRATSDSLSICELSLLLEEHDLQDVYPNVSIALRIVLSNPATNCSGERSFSCLRRVKTYLRSTMSQEMLNALALLNIEKSCVLIWIVKTSYLTLLQQRQEGGMVVTCNNFL